MSVIDFSPLDNTFSDMALKLGIYLLVPFLVSIVVGGIVYRILIKIKFPKELANLIFIGIILVITLLAFVNWLKSF